MGTEENHLQGRPQKRDKILQEDSPSDGGIISFSPQQVDPMIVAAAQNCAYDRSLYIQRL